MSRVRVFDWQRVVRAWMDDHRDCMPCAGLTRRTGGYVVIERYDAEGHSTTAVGRHGPMGYRAHACLYARALVAVSVAEGLAMVAKGAE